MNVIEYDKLRYYQAIRYRKLKKQGLCVDCGRERAMENRVRCFKCLSKDAERSVAKRANWTEEKRQAEKEKNRQRLKALRTERKNNNQCVSCGKSLPTNSQHVSCKECRLKVTDWRWKNDSKRH